MCVSELHGLAVVFSRQSVVSQVKYTSSPLEFPYNFIQRPVDFASLTNDIVE